MFLFQDCVWHIGLFYSITPEMVKIGSGVQKIDPGGWPTVYLVEQSKVIYKWQPLSIACAALPQRTQ